MTAPKRPVGLHRDVHYQLDTLDKIHTHADWLGKHLPDLHDLAYAPSGGSSDDRVQTSDERDLSDQIRRPAQHAWHNLCRALNTALLELQRAEYATGEQFTAGQLPDQDRPGRDTTMPRRIAQQVHQAAARRRQRGEWTPQVLAEET